MTATALQSVDLTRPNGKPAEGLVQVRGRRSRSRLEEEVAVRQAGHLEHVDYVFFRRFDDERSSQVAAFVVDNSDEHATKDELARLHRDVWRQGLAPLLYIAWPTRVDVLTCARGPDFWNSDSEDYSYEPVERIGDAAHTAAAVNAALQEKRRRFSALRLADGTFWDDPRNEQLAKHSEGAHELLIQAVVEADEAIGGQDDPVLRRLLMLTVLIKYLEDRSVFSRKKNWFGQFSKGATTFFEVLQQGRPNDVLRLLRVLEDRFNGDVFALPEEPSARLTKKRLRTFAKMVGARTLKRQRYLWEQFSFRHLPVEVISHLYQRFVRDGHGAVYTPPFLAALLLDHAMPYDKLRGTERVLDPACGSGVFLVGAFRRLVNAWCRRNRWRPPTVETLKSILRRSIFGIDLDPEAVDLAVFSLALAVCDSLKPNVIWRDLSFDPLRDLNIIEGDFFSYVACPDAEEFGAWPAEFDVLVGNPPFESQLSEAGRTLDEAMRKERGALPDKQAAYLFLEQGFKTLKRTGSLCLIQPHGFMHNKKAEAFRQRVFERHQVPAVLDFVSIRKLYDGADPKTVAILAQSKKPAEGHWITHVTFRRTFSVHQRIGFELDHYDYHRVPQRLAEDDPLVWRINLLGGGRLHEMSQRLRPLRTLKQYVELQEWDYGEGFNVGSPWLLSVRDILDWPGFCAALDGERNSVTPSPGGTILKLFPAGVRRTVGDVARGEIPEGGWRAQILRALNGILKRRDLDHEGAFTRVVLPEEVKELLARPRGELPDAQVQRLNRLLLEASYPHEIADSHLDDRAESSSFLTGKPFLPTEALTNTGIDEKALGGVEETRFEKPRLQAIYTPPLVLLREVDSLPLAFWDKSFLVYEKQIVGIHAEERDRDSLRAFFNQVQDRRRFYQLWCAMHGSRALVSKATSILKKDIDALPYPKNSSDLDLSFWEEALQEDVLNYMGEFVRRGQNSALLKRAAGEEALAAYADMFCRLLGSVYEDLKAHDPVFLDGLVCQLFYFGEQPNVDWLDEEHTEALHRLVYDDSRDELRTARRVCFYQENVILIAKPDRLRYWIRSTAIRDADEVLVDLREQGY